MSKYCEVIGSQWYRVEHCHIDLHIHGNYEFNDFILDI